MSARHLDPESLSRRAMLGTLGRALLAAAAFPALLPARLYAAARPDHPDPRAGVTAARVLPDPDVPKKYKDAYAAAREIPQVLDGLHCYCDCADHRGLRSLLSCFESEMPQSCGICLGEARLARRLHARGESLTAIRAAVDRRFGGRGHAH